MTVNGDARRLVKLIEGIPAKINLIPFKRVPAGAYKRSSGNAIHAFAGYLSYKRWICQPDPHPRGGGISNAACVS